MKKIGNIITVVLAISAIIMTGFVINKLWFTSEAKIDERIVNWEKFINEDRMIGSRKAKIQVIKFIDYQCTYCKDLNENFKKLQRKLNQDIAISYRYYPVFGEKSRKIALSAICNKNDFAKYHNWLYKNQDLVSTFEPQKILSQLSNNTNTKIDLECINSNKSREELSDDIKLAETINIKSVPSFIIDGKLIIGSPNLPLLESILKSKL